MGTINWDAVSGFAALVQTIAIVATLIFAARELRNAKQARNFDLVFKMFELFNQPEARANRFQVFTKIPSKPGTLSRDDYNAARDTWNLMNQLGIVYAHNLASEDLIMELFSLQSVRLWRKLEPHIKFYRKTRGNFAVHFEQLALRSQEYRREKYGEEEPLYFDVFSEKTTQQGTGE